jgi:hypothetical protein
MGMWLSELSKYLFFFIEKSCDEKSFKKWFDLQIIFYFDSLDG